MHAFYPTHISVLLSDVWLSDRVDPHERKEPADVITELVYAAHETSLSQGKHNRQRGRVRWRRDE